MQTQGGAESVAKFRFQDFEIWKEAIDLGSILFDIADKLEDKKLFRFAEQLRGAQACPCQIISLKGREVVLKQNLEIFSI